MVEYQRTHAGLGLHHHAFSESHADVLRPQQFPETLLIVQIGARGVAETVALAAILRGEAIMHRRSRRVGEAPLLAHAAMQPLGRPFGSLDRQRLDAVHLSKLAGLLPPF